MNALKKESKNTPGFSTSKNIEKGETMNKLGKSLTESLSGKIHDTMANIGEVGLDLMFEAGALRDIPIISTVIGIYRITDSIRNRHYINQLRGFVEELNNQATTEERREEIRKKLINEGDKLDKEIEYLLIIIDRYIEENKPRLLAKLFIAYLNRRIEWIDLTSYAVIIERLLPNDLETLISCERLNTNTTCINDSILRLSALGLIIEDGTNSIFTVNTYGVGITSDSMGHFAHGDKEYMRTQFGEKLVSIVQ